jgi:hypothetical protein
MQATARAKRQLNVPNANRDPSKRRRCPPASTTRGRHTPPTYCVANGNWTDSLAGCDCRFEFWRNGYAPNVTNC